MGVGSSLAVLAESGASDHSRDESESRDREMGVVCERESDPILFHWGEARRVDPAQSPEGLALEVRVNWR